MESMLRAVPQPDTIPPERASLCRQMREELANLDAMIRFATARRNEVERRLRDLEAMQDAA